MPCQLWSYLRIAIYQLGNVKWIENKIWECLPFTLEYGNISINRYKNTLSVNKMFTKKGHDSLQLMTAILTISLYLIRFKLG